MAGETFKMRETPWWTCYSRPRSTFESILAHYPEAYSIMMALAAGFGMVLQHLFGRGLSRHDLPGSIYLEAFFIGPVFGLMAYFFSGWLFTVLGNRLGGSGTMERNRAVWAWSFVPYLSGMILLWIPLTLAAVARADLHMHLPAAVDRFLMNLEIFFFYAFVPFWGWTVYLFVVGIAVANRFSVRQSVIVILLSYAIVGGVVWALYTGGHLLGALS